MRVFWPWRRKPLQSLFENHVNQDFTHPETAVHHNEPAFNPYPKNAPGGFYVCNEECISCGAPHSVAPDLMEWDTTDEYQHCYFKKQPASAYELIQATRAVEIACCGALRYHGNDPEILLKLREAGLKQAID